MSNQQVQNKPTAAYVLSLLGGILGLLASLDLSRYFYGRFCLGFLVVFGDFQIVVVPVILKLIKPKTMSVMAS